jgi:hypothetical protein
MLPPSSNLNSYPLLSLRTPLARPLRTSCPLILRSLHPQAPGRHPPHEDEFGLCVMDDHPSLGRFRGWVEASFDSPCPGKRRAGVPGRRRGHLQTGWRSKYGTCPMWPRMEEKVQVSLYVKSSCLILMEPAPRPVNETRHAHMRPVLLACRPPCIITAHVRHGCHALWPPSSVSILLLRRGVRRHLAASGRWLAASRAGQSRGTCQRRSRQASRQASSLPAPTPCAPCAWAWMRIMCHPTRCKMAEKGIPSGLAAMHDPARRQVDPRFPQNRLPQDVFLGEIGRLLLQRARAHAHTHTHIHARAHTLARDLEVSCLNTPPQRALLPSFSFTGSGEGLSLPINVPGWSAPAPRSRDSCLPLHLGLVIQSPYPSPTPPPLSLAYMHANEPEGMDASPRGRIFLHVALSSTRLHTHTH